MRLRNFSVGLLLAICCFFLPQQANATTPNTYTYSTIDFDDSTGTILASGHTQADYQTGAYYQYTGAGLMLFDADGNTLGNQQKQVYGLSADASAQTDAEADQTYEVHTGHYILATYYVYNYYYQGYYLNGYYDPYNYTYVEGQNYNNDPEYTYYGNGPVFVSQYTNDIILGMTKKTVKVGTPDHIKVVDDVTNNYSCGTPYRTLTLKSVDINGHGTGKTSIRELFSNPPIVSTCTGQSPHETQCGEAVTHNNAQFTDTISAYCPNPGVALPCGFSVTPNHYQWCSKNGDVTLATFNDDAYDTYVEINGHQDSLKGTNLYP